MCVAKVNLPRGLGKDRSIRGMGFRDFDGSLNKDWLRYMGLVRSISVGFRCAAGLTSLGRSLSPRRKGGNKGLSTTTYLRTWTAKSDLNPNQRKTTTGFRCAIGVTK